MSSILRHVRVRSRSGDEAAVRMAVARQLESADLDAPGIPRSSVLVIRRLRDPLPGRLASSGIAVTADPGWQSAMRRQMDDAARSAARPVGGRIAGDPPAVLFCDEAELVACLALQLAGGGPMTWWREAIADYARDRSLLGLLRRRAEILPAIVTRLVRWHVAEDVVGRLGPSEALSLASVVIAARQLTGLFPLVARFSTDEHGADDPDRLARESSIAEGPDASAPEDGSRDPAGVTLGDEVPVIPPWRAWWSASGATPTHHQLLIGLCVALQLSPGSARSAPFAVRVQEWFEWHRRRGRDEEAARTTEPEVRPRGAEVVQHGAASVADPDTAGAPLPVRRQHERRPVESIPKGEGERRPADRRAAASPRAAVSADSPPVTGDTTAAPESWEREGLVTQLGGVFFLINVMEHLNLPDRFEDSAGLASTVGPMGTLEAIARALLHPVADDVRGDPVWSLLCQLDGREPGAPPRGDGLRTDGLSLPAEWGREGEGSLEVGDDRATGLWSQLAEEAWAPGLVKWMELVLPFIRWRLAAALDAHDGEGTGLLAGFLLLPARVYVTDVHIDVVASIEDVRLPVRLAGLDRSPGWVRSMQRVVLFHFE